MDLISMVIALLTGTSLLCVVFLVKGIDDSHSELVKQREADRRAIAKLQQKVKNLESWI
jgi:hypothetical protein